MANFKIIRDLCDKKNITIRDLATRVGIKENAVHKIIQNNSTNTTTIEEIARVFEVPVGLFFEETPTMSIGDVSSNVANGSSVIGSNVKRNIKNVTHTLPITEDTIKTASLGYQQIIISYQNNMDRLLNIIEKLENRYEN